MVIINGQDGVGQASRVTAARSVARSLEFYQQLDFYSIELNTLLIAFSVCGESAILAIVFFNRRL